MKQDSPLEFGLFGLKNLAKGFANRKEYGGGLKGMFGAVKGQITGEHGDDKIDQINSKLDTLIGADGQSNQNPQPVSITGGGSLGTSYENAPAPAPVPVEEEVVESPMAMKGPLFFNENFRKLPKNVQKDIINKSKNK